jgi:hypothetical protein
VRVCQAPNDVVKKFLLLRNKNSTYLVGMDRPLNH